MQENMADKNGCVYFLIQWEDRYLSVIHQNKVVQPKKNGYSYQEGEIITAYYGKEKYKAVICEIHADKKVLEKRTTYPPKHNYDGAKERTQGKSKGSAQLKEIAETEKKQRTQDEKDAKKEREAAMRKSKQTLLDNLSKKLNESESSCLAGFHNFDSAAAHQSSRSPTLSPSSPSSSDSDIISVTPLKSKRLASFTPRKSPRLNQKGHPMVAHKQPRTLFSGSNTSPSPRCTKCGDLEKENTALKRKIENSMQELFPGMGVYVHQDQYQTALNKSVSCLSPRHKGLNDDTKRDGKRVARYPLNVFFTKDQLQKSSLTNSELSKYPGLDQHIVDAITAFSTYHSDSTKGDVLKAMRASLTSKRCKGKKARQTSA